MTSEAAGTLRDLGERRMIEELVQPLCPGSGDDCAWIEADGIFVVTTIDPAPIPAAVLLSGDQDPYWRGWLAVVINASDLAAAGADPASFLLALECPPSTPVEEFSRFLEGVADACQVESLQYQGGNVKEGDWHAVGTAIGTVTEGRPLTRSGASPGEVLLSVGLGGIFWQDVLTYRAGGCVDRNESPLFRPRSQSSAMAALRRRGLATAAIDNSDGLLPSAYQLAKSSGIGLELDLDAMVLEDSDPETDPARLWLGWGDWNVLTAVPLPDVEESIVVAAAHGSDARVIGRAVDSPRTVRLRRGAVISDAPRLESERFAADSWFQRGLDAYLQDLQRIEIP